MKSKTHESPPGSAPPPGNRQPIDPEAVLKPDARETVTIPVSEYEEVKAQAADFKDRWLRAAADYDNLRKRMEKEREQIMCYANERLIMDLLPILDSLDRALHTPSGAGSAQKISEGVKMIERQLTGVLEACGLEPLKAVGSVFDPNMHQAVSVLPSDAHTEGTVVGELQKGYRLKGKVLRPSMVHVAGSPVDDSAQEEDLVTEEGAGESEEP